ncbi:AfsR/SARP family transcriptional regulator [Streptomyces sp. NPDC000070]|uniref:AfsR/SARP family transcriptional regulator n=1 Tax=Streptomyces sp. NPDC000070 TaxID=3154240 RepID=UPI00332B3515
MKFRLLGPLEVTLEAGNPCVSLTPKAGQVLAVLAVQPGQVVGADALVRELWGDRPPRSATTTMRTYVYHARKMFARQGVTAPERLLVTCGPGYLIHLDPQDVDTRVFERLVRKGQEEMNEELYENAAGTLREAIGLWRGPVLADLPVGEVLSGHVAYLDALRVRALELRITADRRLGRHRELIPELHRLVETHPLNEWFHAQLIEVLGTAGRRAEALQAYQRLRYTLVSELGLEPSPSLQQLHRRLLGPAQPTGPARRAA